MTEPPEPFQQTSSSFDATFRNVWIDSSPKQRIRFLGGLSANELAYLRSRWGIFAHAHQREPAGDWTTWLMLGGRGAGKTRAGAEWVKSIALADPAARIALVGETEHDVREVMIEGVSGLMDVHAPHERPAWTPTRKRVEWRNGAVAQVFSAENAEGLRGPQFSHAWLDELAKWKNAQQAFDMLQFGLRLGQRPRQVITTTPRPIPLIKALMADGRTALTHAATQANAYNLAPAFLDAILGRYAGTRLGRQEIEGLLTFFECPGFAVALFHALWSGEPQVVNAFADLSGLIMAYMAARFGVLGVYVSSRSREKRLSAGQQPSTVLGEIVKAATRRK